MTKRRFLNSLLLVIGLTTATSCFAQTPHRKTPPDSCISFLKTVSFSKIDSINSLISKIAVPDLLKRIEYCEHGYKHIDSYNDKAFELTAPNYISRYTEGFGDNCYYINLDDFEKLERSIVVYYDFDDSYKAFFLNEIETGKLKAQVKIIEGRKMYLFQNWEHKFCGKLFLENNTFIFYCTRKQEYENELQKAILTFKWK